jgi:hypothetical protein
MDESALRDRLDRIERRQRLVLVLLAVPYLLGAAELLGYWRAGALGAAVGVVAFAAFVRARRRDRNAVE